MNQQRPRLSKRRTRALSHIDSPCAIPLHPCSTPTDVMVRLSYRTLTRNQRSNPEDDLGVTVLVVDDNELYAHHVPFEGRRGIFGNSAGEALAGPRDRPRSHPAPDLTDLPGMRPIDVRENPGVPILALSDPDNHRAVEYVQHGAIDHLENRSREACEGGTSNLESRTRAAGGQTTFATGLASRTCSPEAPRCFAPDQVRSVAGTAPVLIRGETEQARN